MTMRNTTRKTRRTGAGVVATLAASALAFVGLAMPSASAAEVPHPLPDGGKTATLTIHKHETPSGAEGNGLPATVTTPALEGVGFKAERITDIDLTTSSGWQAAQAMTVQGAKDAAKDPAVTGTTGVGGELSLPDLPLGLYLVSETSTPAGVVASAPFLVTLPLTHPTALNEWLYTVHVYPKNDKVTVTKTVEDTGAVKLGDEVVWTIVGDLPSLENTTLDAYKIVDDLDSKLDYVSAAVSLTQGTGDGTDETLAAGDYTVTPAAPTANGPEVTVTFTEQGLAKLTRAAARGQQVEVVITTEVNAVGEVANQATLFPNQQSIDANTGTTSEDPVTKFGGIRLQKEDAASSAALQGAEFQVFLSEADARAGNNPVFGDAVFTTNADGQVVIDGLRYSSWEDGVQLDPMRGYWLLEVKAPAGYELLTAPVEFFVTGQVSETINLTVENVPHNAGFDLPLTGGAGTTWLTIAGLLVLVAAGALLARSRRQAGPAEALTTES